MNPSTGPYTLPVDIDVDVRVDPPSGQWGLLVAVLVFVLLVLIVLRGMGAGYDFRVKVRGRDVVITGKRISAALRSELHHFFVNDFGPRKRLTMYARRRRNRTYELRFSGRVTAGEKQQVRNFLMARV